MADVKPAPRRAPRLPPYGGFRAIFAIINGALWFVLAGAVSLGASFGLVAADRLTPSALATGAAAACFFAAFFGMPGALTGFLGLARDRSFALPPESRWGDGRLGQIWLYALVYAMTFGPIGYGATAFLAGEGEIGRGDFCLIVATAGAAAGVFQAFLVAGPGALGDLRPHDWAQPAPTTRWLFFRAGLPQGFGNGLITALIAAGTIPSGAAVVRMPVPALIGDAAGTGLVVALFMVFTAGGLAAMDRKLGHVGGAAVRPSTPGEKLLISFVASVACAFLALVVGFATSGSGMPPAVYVGWKALVGGGVGALTAMRAAEWGIAATDAAVVR